MALNLAGRFRLIEKDKELFVHIFGGVEKEQIRQKHVDFICDFYNVPRTDRWLLEDAKREPGFYLIVKKGD